MMHARGMVESRTLQTDIKFAKTGAQISSAIASKSADIDAEQQAIKAQLAEICKRRDVTMEEVLGASSEEEHTAYSTKASSSLGQSPETLPNSIIKGLQNDLNQLRALSNTYKYNTSRLKDLSRVSNNVISTDTYLLSYDELLTFGF